MEKLVLKKMTQKEAEIIGAWKYPKPYNFYNMTADEEDFELFRNPEKRSPHTYSVYEHTNLIGFFRFTQVDEMTIDISLGLHPLWTGKGKGKSFIDQGLAFAANYYGVTRFTLSVASFNTRAILVYERVGFCKKKRISRRQMVDILNSSTWKNHEGQ